MKTALAIALLAGISLHAQADTLLHPIITASRIAQSADQTMAPVTVITHSDIEQSQDQSLVQILRDRVPGLDFVTTGGTGHQVNTFLRGTGSTQFLLMIDGNVVGSATTGSAAIDQIPLENIQRIEVVRGPRSSLYGSNAIGGVIQIFTRDSNKTTASVTAGSERTSGINMATQLGNKDNKLNLAVDHYHTRGFNVTNDSEGDPDGYTSNSGNLRYKKSLGKNTQFFANGFYAKGHTLFDNNTYGNYSDSVEQNYQLGVDSDITNDLHSKFDAGQSKDNLVTNLNSRSFSNPSIITNQVTVFTTKRNQAHWTNTLNFSDTGQSSFGADYVNDKVESTTHYSEHQRSNRAVYALVQDKFGRHQLQAAARLDHNEAFGSHTTGSLAWAYDISGDKQIRISKGTAFVAPSFNDLYYVDPYFSGNPNLKPETSVNSELDFTLTKDWGTWDLNTYHTVISNIIVLNNSYTSVTNADKAQINGVESELDLAFSNWAANMNVSIINPVDVGTGKVLQGRAKRTLKLNATRTIGDYTLGAGLLAQSSRFANASNSLELPGYVVVNLTAGRKLNKHWRLKARVKNLLNKSYSTSVDFYQNTTNNPPVSLFVTLQYTE